MPKLDLSIKDQAALVERIKEYVLNEFEIEIGRFEAEGMMEFFAKAIGNHFYNRGLYDAQSVIVSQIDAINDAIYQLEQQVEA